MTMTSRVVIDPALRGRVSPPLLARLQRAGLHVHRVGRAAYVHNAGVRWLLVVTPAPDLEAQIDARHRWLIGRGAITPDERRRERAWLARRGGLPWWAGTELLQPWRVA